MKLLCLCSALDLRYRYGCTPAWWQFLKGLYELGHDIIAIPYQGTAVESPWWRVYPNPCEVESKTYTLFKKLVGSSATSTEAGISGKVAKGLIESWVRPRWKAHLTHVIEKEGNVDAVIVFSVPLNHFTGLPEYIRSQYHIPATYYDGDVPASLPRFGGFASGFKIYEGADLAEYDGFLCNSEGGAEDLRHMGARRVETVHWGVDPDLYTPLDMKFDRDVFFYGFGAEYRESWIQAMLVEPSRALTDHTFAVGGPGFARDLGRVAQVGDVPFNVFRHACCRSRINLNITREAHATVFASSSMRPFELAAMGCCVVSNPCAGMETWFEVGEEVLIVHSAAEAIETYRNLLADEGRRRAIGGRARQRVLADHTHRHRAAQLIEFVETL